MRRNREAGQALVTAALTLTVLLLAAGLAIDMGYMRYQKRAMQTAADSAALAAAAEFNGDYAGAAQADASLNGFTASSVGSCPLNTSGLAVGQVAMCAQQGPPASSPASITAACAGSISPCAQVTISQSEPTFFMRIAGVNSEIVSASAVARLGNGPGCLYALGPDLSYVDANGVQYTADLNLDANYVNATGCAVMSGGTVGSSAQSHLTDANTGDTTGTCSGACAQLIPSTVQTIAPPPDPLAYLQSNIPSPQTPAANCPPFNYCPGSYPSGINLTGNNLAVSFAPGTYVLGNGNCTTCGLTISGTGTVTGNGVMFYNSGASAISINAPGSPYDSCTNSDVTVQLVAPSAPGIYSGILFFQDVNDTQQMVLQMSNGTVCGGGGPSISNAAATASYAFGAIYAPGALAKVMGLSPSYNGYCSYIPRYTLVVALDIILGGADVNINMDDCDGTAYPNVNNPVPNGPILPPDPIKAAVLVE
jgi:hypothetical protein